MSKINYEDKEFLYENADIPAKNKAKDVDFNEIKGVVNQESKFTATTYDSTNHNFKCNLLGSLTAGDTIQVILDLSQTIEYQNVDISISVDNGATYYTLLDKTSDFTLKPYDFKGNQIYLKAVFNGTNLVLISPERVKSLLTTMRENEVEMSTASQYQAVSLDTIMAKKGGRLTTAPTIGADTGIIGIKIGRGVSKVKINSNTQFTNNNNTSAMYFIGYLYKDGNVREFLARALTPNISSGGNSGCSSITPMTIEVSEGDIIYLRAFKSITSGIATINAQQRTYITVEEVD